MKKKLFYFSLPLFFLVCILGTGLHVYCAELSAEDKAEIVAIEKHNKEQEKNKLTLEKFYKENPNSMTPQDDDYWDLAWHARLADYGDKDSQYVVAQAYEQGRDVDANPRKAVAFYERSCDQDHIDACMRLGEIYTENKWVKPDREKALYWYVRAAKSNYTPAQFKVSQLYEEQGDYRAAIQWLEQALKTLFPKAKDLADHSPKWEKLHKQAVLQKKMNDRGIYHLVLHESCLLPLKPKQVREPKSKQVFTSQTTPNKIVPSKSRVIPKSKQVDS